MSRLKVVLVVPPAVACRNPTAMTYGGVERAAWRLARLLSGLGCEVVPIASADSDFGTDIATRGLSPVESWCRADRTPPVHTEDTAALLGQYAEHAHQIVERERASAVLMLGPGLVVLRGVLAAARQAGSKTAVTLHNGPADNVDTTPMLAAASNVVIFCLSEVQRNSFKGLKTRLEVVTDGIPVAAVPFSPDPAAARARLRQDPAYDGVRLSSERPLLGHIDYFHANKAMLTTLRIFRESGLWRTHDLLLAGGPGWQLPTRSRQAEKTYLDTMREYVTKSDLHDCVQILGALSGRQVAELYGAMDLALSPVRLEDPPEARDAESYGQGRAIANSAGTPVLMSTAYDPAFCARPDLRFNDAKEGTARLREFTASTELRREMRDFAERRDAMAPGLARYARFIGLDPAVGDAEAAIAGLVHSEIAGDAR